DGVLADAVLLEAEVPEDVTRPFDRGSGIEKERGATGSDRASRTSGKRAATVDDDAPSVGVVDGFDESALRTVSATADPSPVGRSTIARDALDRRRRSPTRIPRQRVRGRRAAAGTGTEAAGGAPGRRTCAGGSRGAGTARARTRRSRCRDCGRGGASRPAGAGARSCPA